jgi:pimeloyl-ACP methyl ester carboxylesterase
MPPGAAAASEFAVEAAATIRGERAGEGPPIVLCHGLTATRRTVLHGSRALERAGHMVITYDARGHGDSEPAPEGAGYGYPELVDDLEAVLDAQVGEERAIVGGHSMGAHIAVACALRKPERVAGLVVIGPAYGGSIEASSLPYWDGLARALADGGVDDFVAYIEREQPLEPRWRDPVLRFTRERMLRHRDLDAIVAALREVPRSRPFSGLAELESLEMPALVVASRDAADPGHPYAIARSYAASLPRARFAVEPEGQSPLAWQGGRLSREIAAFAAAV